MSYLTLPFIPAFSALGLVAPDSKLYFYQSGTTTPVTVYADAGLTTPLSNPVVANAGGRFADIYLNDSITYRIRLESAFGGLIDEVDPYTTPLGNLGGSGGSASMGFIQAGTNPLAKTVQSELRRTIDASQFIGFDPTGATDSTAAVQNALNLASALGGAEVTISSGRVLICSSGSLTIPAQCALVGPYVNGVDNGGTNLSSPYGTMGGTLISDAGPGRTILVKGTIKGFLIHRKGMTFPSTTAGSDYTGDAVSLAGDGASATDCMILGFNRAVYSRNWQRIFCYNLKIDCVNGIDIRQAGDTSIIFRCKGWPWAGGGSNALSARSGSFVRLWGRNDWTQVIQCEEYGYYRGYDLRNEVSDQGQTYGPANCRIIQCKSDGGWGSGAPYQTGKIAVRIGGDSTNESSGPCKAFDVQIESLQSSCAAVAAIYSNIENGMTLHVVNCFCWNGPAFGLVQQINGNLVVTGGATNGSGPGDPTAYSQYGLTYAVADGSGKLFVGGGFRVTAVTTANIRIGYDTSNVTFGYIVPHPSVPMTDNAAKKGVTIASASTLALPPPLSPNDLFLVSGTTTIASLSGGFAGRRVTLIFSGSITITHSTANAQSMRLSGSTNFAAANGSTLSLVHNGDLWFETGRST